MKGARTSPIGLTSALICALVSAAYILFRAPETASHAITNSSFAVLFIVVGTFSVVVLATASLLFERRKVPALLSLVMLVAVQGDWAPLNTMMGLGLAIGWGPYLGFLVAMTILLIPRLRRRFLRSSCNAQHHDVTPH